MAKRNQELIENFIRRTGWDMQKTGTGLWYMITSHGSGRAVTEGDVVVITYRACLLDGKLVDAALPGHPRVFRSREGRR